MKYGLFCPVAKAAELLCERWTLLILRELLHGTSKYSELQRGLSRISPTLLSKRLRELEQAELLYRQRIAGGKGYEYFLTESGRAVGPLVVMLGHWGLHWYRSQITDDELDPELLLWDIQRRLDDSYFPGGRAVLKFQFNDVPAYPNWWLMANGAERDLCHADPGRDVNVYFSGSARTLIEVWGGALPLEDARNNRNFKIVGDRQLVETLPRWFLLSSLATTPSALRPHTAITQ
ncbi:helix-turn-helix domain-containing protein [Microbulbifer bruguierae]|uniref:Helix-turn-helix domain-containing protein n=1 Tax=Microbulbifer bruguierae TaxID=3029061 RepID=A0ABY8NBA8_9GAMM|nr:helix-turn-helix domain-containing protein [Microbulbifer bruguierae]WGL15867.1 helix-turn-helix domain-containing protein [Microbulbifer bruguierae]